MSYELGFVEAALKEWRKLDQTVRDQFRKKLAERLVHPHVDSARLSGRKNRYKVKLRSIGYRLVYEVRDESSLIVVMAVGRRDRNAVYEAADKR